MAATNTIKEAAQTGDPRHIHTIVHHLFDWDLAPGQVRIVRKIAWETTPRLAVTGATQYGKSLAVAVSVALLILWDPGPLRVAVVAPKLDQTKKVRNYVAQCVARCPALADLLEDARSGDTADRLRREASKRRITFRQDKTLETHTAGGSLMSQGADVVILDEAGELTDDQYAEARRMIGGAAGEGRLVEIGNPWPATPFEESWGDPRYETVRIDAAQAIEEGRLSEAFVEEQRDRVADYLYTVYYASRFPDAVEDALYRTSWLRDAFHRDPVAPNGEHVWGLDVAEGGADNNVLTHVRRDAWRVDVLAQYRWSEPNTTVTANRAASHLPTDARITVDSIGVGKGVADQLGEMGYRVTQWKASHKARDGDDYANRKAEVAWGLREALEEGTVSMSQLEEAMRRALRDDLTRYRRDYRRGKVDWQVAGGKSPDHGDSLLQALGGKAGSSSWSEL